MWRLQAAKGHPQFAELNRQRVLLRDERSWGVTFFLNGRRSFELREWTVMEDTLGLRVNFSDQSVELA
jgi:hypothetical protein